MQCSNWLSRSREALTYLVRCYDVNEQVRYGGCLSVKADTKLRSTLGNISRVRRTANFGVNTPIWRSVLVLRNFNTFTTFVELLTPFP